MSSISAAPPAADIGVIGLGVMGASLALNLEGHGYRVALWNHTEAKVTRLIQGADASRQWIGTQTLEEFAAALSRPRRAVRR
jgi:6-phosphogluconate dehydrogenase